MGRYAIFNGLVYGGETDVIPNPEGTPTDELHSLQIGDDIYEIVGGGGSGGNASLDATTLYDTPITSTGTYTLADDYNNYDFIGFKAGNGSTETDIRLYAVKDIQDSMNDNLVITNNVTNSWFNFTINENELTIPGKTVSTIYSVIGYKIKGGGSTDKVTKVYDAVPSGDGCSIVVAEHIWLRDSGGSVSYSTAEYPDITSVDNFIARLTQTAMDDGSSDYNTNITFTFDDTNKTIEMSWGTLSGSSGCYVDIVYSLVEPVVVASDVEISNTNTVTYDISSIIPTYQTLASKDFMFNLKHIYSDNDGLGTSSPFNINFNNNTGVLTVSWNDIGTNNVLTGDILLLYKEDGYKLIRDMQPPTETSSGYHGYVPAPKVGDENKFLRGDGTWSEGSGSSNVEANPTGTPTDTLNTIGIDGTIYDIKGSGGGDGYKLEKIFDGNVTTTGNITLNKSISNYDELLFVLNFTRELGESYITTFNVDVSIFKNIGNYTAARGVLLNDWSKDSRFAQVKYVDDMTIDVDAIQVVSIVEIYGVKLEGSGSSGSQELISYDTTITTTQYGWWTAEDKDGNVLDPDQYELIAVTPFVNNSPSWVGSWNGAFYINSVDGVTHRYDVTFVNINDGGYIRTSRTWDVKVIYRDKNAAGGGGGSTVVPNPEEEPTDTLNTVEIDGIVYNIEGSGGGGDGYTETVLFEESESTYAGIKELSDNISNYDELIFRSVYENSQTTYEQRVSTSLIEEIGYIQNPTSSSNHISLEFGYDQSFYRMVRGENDNELNIFQVSGTRHVVTIIGVKYEGSGGGGTSEGEGVEIYSEDEYIVGKWVDGKKLYQKSIKFSATSLSTSWMTIEQDVDYNLAFPEVQGLYYTANGEPFTQSTRVFVQNGELKIQPLKELDLLSGTLKHVITIRYTKTVETPAPAWGGSVNNYYANFIDTNNVIVPSTTWTGSMSYTATEDCYIILENDVQNGHFKVTIDGVEVYDCGTSGQYVSIKQPFAIKKGQILGATSNQSNTLHYTVYGVSYSSGGSSSESKIEYSTEEKEIGTWIDGSKVYELTIFNDNLTDTSTVPNAMYIGSIPNNANIVTELSVSVCDSNHAGWVTGGGICTVNGWNFGLHITQGKVVLYGGNVSAIQGGMAIAKIRYTKTTT